VAGTVNVSGGNRGLLEMENVSLQASAEITGGAGSPGFVRFEAPGTLVPATALPNMIPAATAANVATLTDTDLRVGFQTEFYTTGQPFGPDWVRYEIEALVNGVPTVFSDDPARGTAASVGLAPIEIYFQGGRMDLTNNTIVPGTIKPWRSRVKGSATEPSLADDALNAYRFQVLLDRTMGQQVVLQTVKVFYRS
jgi:hypothetical protein